MKKTLDKLQSKASDTQPHESCSADDQHADEPVSPQEKRTMRSSNISARNPASNN